MAGPLDPNSPPASSTPKRRGRAAPAPRDPTQSGHSVPTHWVTAFDREALRSCPVTDDEAMAIALGEARDAADAGEVPVGAVVLGPDGALLARRRNEREAAADPTAHAELLALRDAARALGTWRLTGCTLVVTLEPCPMCAGALVNARLGRLVFGAADPKAGATGSLYNLCADPRLNHEVDVVHGIQADAAGKLLADFFRSRRR